MDAGFFFNQALTGLASASTLFLIACGLTIIFGVTRIVNFAHGSLFMLGAYLAVSLEPHMGFWLAVPLAALGVGVLGVVLEVLLLRRIYHAPELFQLLATFGVVLIVQDGVLLLWGPDNIPGPRAPGLDGAVALPGGLFPEYDLLIILAGPAVLGLLWVLFRRTRWGTLVRAATEDREMVAALGVNQATLFTGVLFLGALLAGLAGALQIPREPASPFMDMNIIVEAFVVTVIGGMGSMTGAFLAALLLGEMQAFGILVFPKVTLVLVFLVMAVVLVLRPHGLVRRPPPTDSAPVAMGALEDGGRRGLLGWLAVFVLLAGAPLLGDKYLLVLLNEALIAALFAYSLHVLMGAGGMISFGHAALFGLGAYGSALMVHHFAFGMSPALLLAPLAGALGGGLIGLFCVRLSGVYLAMLSLAFAQIFWSLAFQWVEVTGGDNGLIGIWPAPWASGRIAYFYLVLIISGIGLMALRHLLIAPFGYTLRAGRDSLRRSAAIGIDVTHHRWLAFVLAGAAAGLGGGLYAFSKGTVGPDVLSIPHSVDALVMMLLGGMETLTGPLIGGAAFTLLKAQLMPLTELWRLTLGGIIILLVLVFPQGLWGVATRIGTWWQAQRKKQREKKTVPHSETVP